MKAASSPHPLRSKTGESQQTQRYEARLWTEAEQRAVDLRRGFANRRSGFQSDS